MPDPYIAPDVTTALKAKLSSGTSPFRVMFGLRVLFHADPQNFFSGDFGAPFFGRLLGRILHSCGRVAADVSEFPILLSVELCLYAFSDRWRRK